MTTIVVIVMRRCMTLVRMISLIAAAVVGTALLTGVSMMMIRPAIPAGIVWCVAIVTGCMHTVSMIVAASV